MIKRFFNEHGKLIIRIGGIIGIVAAVLLLVSGVYLLAQKSTDKDHSAPGGKSFFSTWNFDVESDSYAILIEPQTLDLSGDWDTGEIGFFKVLVDPGDSGKELFIGTAASDDMMSYLNGVGYDKMTALRILPSHAEYLGYEGASLPADPLSREIWVKKSYGDGESYIIWNPGDESTSLLIANLDGSAGIDSYVQIKTTVGILFIAGIINLMAGGFILILSLMAVLYAGRERNVVYPKPLLIYSDKKKEQEADL